MSISKKSEEVRKDNPEVENNSPVQNDNKTNEEAAENCGNTNGDEIVDTLRKQLEENETKCDEYLSRLQRVAAEFDNYKKRTAKEREALCTDSMADVVAAILPVLDNFERALQVTGSSEDFNALKDGLALVFKQFTDILADLGVVEIKSMGETFDPNFHNAVMHVEDDSAGDNTIVEVFQKGYRMKDKIVRHSMVKVAN